MKKMKISEIKDEIKWSYGKYQIILRKTKEGFIISVVQKMLLVSLSLYHITENKIPEDDELNIAEIGSGNTAQFMLSYDGDKKGLSFKKETLTIYNFTGNSEFGVLIEL